MNMKNDGGHISALPKGSQASIGVQMPAFISWPEDLCSQKHVGFVQIQHQDKFI